MKRCLILSLLLLTILPARANASIEEYHVNLILQRTTPDLSLWKETWQIFRREWLPLLNSSGSEQFRVSADNNRAVFYLTKAYTTDFDATYDAFQSIPSMLPPNEFFTVSVEGPFRGASMPPADMTVNGKGEGYDKAALKKRLKGRKKWKMFFDLLNSTDIAGIFSAEMFGSMCHRRRGCKIVVRDQYGSNCYAALRARRYQTSVIQPAQTFRWYTTVQKKRTTPDRGAQAAELKSIMITANDAQPAKFQPRLSDSARISCFPR